MYGYIVLAALCTFIVITSKKLKCGDVKKKIWELCLSCLKLFKNNQHDVTCGLSFIFMGSRHSLSTCFELSRSSSSGDHFSVQSASGIVYNLCCSPPVLLQSGAEHVGEREGYSKDYTLYQRLIVQEKWSPDDELPDSSKHAENEWRLPMKIKDSPQVTSCWLFLNNCNDARNNECKICVYLFFKS